MAVASLLENENQQRREDEKAAILHGEPITKGTHKDAYRGLRGMVKPMPEEDFQEENHRRLTHTELVADAEINTRDFTEIGLWENTAVIDQEEADRTLEEAVQHHGTDHVVKETVENLLDEFTERGIVYSDPEDNIGFFNGEAKAFDVYDESSFDLYDTGPENMNEAEYHRFKQEAPAMYQKFASDLATYTPEQTETAVHKVTQASDHLKTGEATITDFQQAFRYRR